MGTGNKITYNPPDWLTVSFLEEIFRDYLQDFATTVYDLKATQLQIPILVKNKFNYGNASVLHRVNFKIRKGDHNETIVKYSVIIKEHPKDNFGVIAHKHRLFKREIHVYKEIMPRINDLLRSINDPVCKISPICFYTTETPEPFLILEDLNSNKYELFEPERLFSLEQALLVIEKIAKFHACSVMIATDNPGIMDFFEEGPISKNPDRQEFLGFFPANIRYLAEEVAKWKGYEEICEKLYKLEDTILEKGVELFESNSNEFRVLNLGDLWISNIMIRCNDELVPDDVILLDYQLAYYGSPAIDLNYFIYGSINENVRKVHFKFIVREYHRYLKETLMKLNYQGTIPSLKDIHIEMIKKSLHAVIAAACLTPIIFSNSTDSDLTDSYDEVFNHGENDNTSRRQTSNIDHPKYKAFIQRTLKEFELSGFLD